MIGSLSATDLMLSIWLEFNEVFKGIKSSTTNSSPIA